MDFFYFVLSRFLTVLSQFLSRISFCWLWPLNYHLKQVLDISLTFAILPFHLLKTDPWCFSYYLGIADNSSKHIAKLVSRQRVNSSKSRRILKAPISTKPLVVPDHFRRNIKELLSVYPNGVLGSTFTQAYTRHYGEELNCSRLGFKSMSQLLNALQDIVIVTKNPNGGFRVCAAAKQNKGTEAPPGIWVYF